MRQFIYSSGGHKDADVMLTLYTESRIKSDSCHMVASNPPEPLVRPSNPVQCGRLQALNNGRPDLNPTSTTLFVELKFPLRKTGIIPLFFTVFLWGLNEIVYMKVLCK